MSRDTQASSAPGSVTRREFLKTSTAAAVAGAVATQLLPRAYAQENNTLRVGLIGCGGRGTGAAAQTLQADANTQLVAMGDAFQERLESSLANLQETEFADRVLVDPDHQFVGLDAYQKVIDSGVDVVLLTTVPHFRPMHMEAAIAAGKHVFAEKPIAVDPVGVRKVLALSEEAKQKGLAVVSGLCWRYELGMRDVVKRVQDGQIGDIIAVQSTRFSGSVGTPTPRQPEWGDFYFQLKNWYYHTWLSGDFNVEQFVHELDKVAWAIGSYPTSCLCTGGRQVRTGPEFGDIFDHFDAIYEWPNGTKYFAANRHWDGCAGIHRDYVMGTQGAADLMAYTITGANPWKGEGNLGPAYVREHQEMYESIRAGEPKNDGEFMSNSTLMGIMARMSAYTGQQLTWDQVMNSQLDLSPPAYDMDATLPAPEVAKPGVTPLV